MLRLFLLASLTACASTQPTRPTPEPAADPAPSQALPLTQQPEQPTVDDDDVAHHNASQIMPGDSIGPVTAQTSYTVLEERLGASALEDAPLAVGEGMMLAGTRIHPDTPHELHVGWRSEQREHAERVMVVGTAWELPGGLHRGAAYSELQQALGTFQVHGFGWDYGGTVRLEGSALGSSAKTLVLRLSPPAGADTGALTGDELFASDNADLVALAPTLDTIIALFPE